jgi:tripartite-type tricarboxylate transporter receptor subunit TctC
VDGGQLRVLASTGTQRISVLPDVPTMREAGFEDFVVLSYIGMWAPKDTPDAVVLRLYGAVREALALPRIKDLRSRDRGHAVQGIPQLSGT